MVSLEPRCQGLRERFASTLTVSTGKSQQPEMKATIPMTVIFRPPADQAAAETPRALSLADPLVAWVAKRKMRAFFVYGANYLIDKRLNVIVYAEGSCANSLEEYRDALPLTLSNHYKT